MHHEIHEGEANHGGIEVVAVKALLQNVLCFLRQQSANAGADEAVIIWREGLAFLCLLLRKLRDDVLVSIQQETGGAASRVADAMAELGINQFTDELDDVARGAELAVLAGAADFIQQHFINIALDVLKQMAFLFGVPLDLDKNVLDDLDGALEQVGAGNDKDRIGHVLGESAAVAIEILDEGKNFLLNVRQHEFRLHFLEIAPAQGGFVNGEPLQFLFARGSVHVHYCEYCSISSSNALARARSWGRI